MKWPCLLFFVIQFPLFALTDSNVGTELSVFHQPGTRFLNQGYTSEFTAEQTLGSGFTLKEKAGYEHFIGDGGGNHHGIRTLIAGMYPVSQTIEINAHGGYRTLGRKSGDYELATSFDSKLEAFELNVGFERSFIMDSYLAYTGYSLSENISLGEARSHLFHAGMTWNEGVLRYRLRPSGGWITAASSPSNFKGAVKGSAELLMIQEDEFDLDLIYQAEIQHFQMDQSGTTYSTIEPYPGGYFSPRLLIEQVPHIAMRYRPDNDIELSLLIGPSLQITKEFQKETVFGVGAVSHFTFDYRMNKWASLRADVSYFSLARQFGRFQSSLGLAYNL